MLSNPDVGYEVPDAQLSAANVDSACSSAGLRWFEIEAGSDLNIAWCSGTLNLVILLGNIQFNYTPVYMLSRFSYMYMSIK